MRRERNCGRKVADLSPNFGKRVTVLCSWTGRAYRRDLGSFTKKSSLGTENEKGSHTHTIQPLDPTN